jgi:hypothetical protein
MKQQWIRFGRLLLEVRMALAENAVSFRCRTRAMLRGHMFIEKCPANAELNCFTIGE